MKEENYLAPLKAGPISQNGTCVVVTFVISEVPMPKARRVLSL
jgi:hypothetical protein